MTRRSAAALSLCAVVLLAPAGGEAQTPSKPARIGLLSVGTAADSKFCIDGFSDELRTLGWIEGQHYAKVARWAEGKPERLPELAKELVAENVDLIFAGTTPDVAAARRATARIPIVMLTPGDPVGAGLVASLARPGGNVTGTSMLLGTAVFAKHLELLTQAVPGLRRVAVLVNPANPAHAGQLKHLETAADALQVQLAPVAITGPEDLERLLPAGGDRAQGLLVLADPVLWVYRARIAELAAARRLPAMYSIQGHVMSGGLMEYAPSLLSLCRRVAHYADKILKGARPGDLPVEQPVTFSLVVNQKAARAIGLNLAPTFLVRADRVID